MGTNDAEFGATKVCQHTHWHTDGLVRDDKYHVICTDCGVPLWVEKHADLAVPTHEFWCGVIDNNACDCGFVETGKKRKIDPQHQHAWKSHESVEGALVCDCGMAHKSRVIIPK